MPLIDDLSSSGSLSSSSSSIWLLQSSTTVGSSRTGLYMGVRYAVEIGVRLKSLMAWETALSFFFACCKSQNVNFVRKILCKGYKPYNSGISASIRPRPPGRALCVTLGDVVLVTRATTYWANFMFLVGYWHIFTTGIGTSRRNSR